MTYCVGIKLREGLVLLSDTRTNAGVDNISRFKKMFTFENPGERCITLMTAGNLSITQGVIAMLEEQIANTGDDTESLLTCATVQDSARLVGNAMRAMQKQHRGKAPVQDSLFDASIIVAGQRKGGELRLYLVYSEGNYIEATDDTPFFQIGEHKYGKPILDRVIDIDTPLQDAVQAALLSMDSTLRSNLSVGMPLDLAIIEADAPGYAVNKRIEADDEDFAALSRHWSEALRDAFTGMPAFTAL